MPTASIMSAWIVTNPQKRTDEIHTARYSKCQSFFWTGRVGNAYHCGRSAPNPYLRRIRGLATPTHLSYDCSVCGVYFPATGFEGFAAGFEDFSAALDDFASIPPLMICGPCSNLKLAGPACMNSRIRFHRFGYPGNEWTTTSICRPEPLYPP
jgi:hypothetical protein